MMTPLKPSEKRLLAIFGVAAFILLNLLGFSWYSKKRLLLEQQASKLETRGRILEGMKSRAPEAEHKQAYLAENLKAYPSETARENYLDDYINGLVSKLDLSLRANQILDPKLEDLFHKSRYKGEVTGKWDNVLQFIYELQQPSQFRFVPNLSLKPQKKDATSDEPADVVCVFTIEKWWSPDSVPTPVNDGMPPADTSAEAPPAGKPSANSEQSAPALVRDQNVTAAIK